MRLSEYLPEAIRGPAAVMYSLVPGNRRLELVKAPESRA